MRKARNRFRVYVYLPSQPIPVPSAKKHAFGSMSTLPPNPGADATKHAIGSMSTLPPNPGAQCEKARNRFRVYPRRCADLRRYLILGFLPCSTLKLRNHSCYRSSTSIFFYKFFFFLNLTLHVRIYSSVFGTPMCGPETLSYSRVSSVIDTNITRSLLLPFL